MEEVALNKEQGSGEQGIQQTLAHEEVGIDEALSRRKCTRVKETPMYLNDYVCEQMRNQSDNSEQTDREDS